MAVPNLILQMKRTCKKKKPALSDLNLALVQPSGNTVVLNDFEKLQSIKEVSQLKEVLYNYFNQITEATKVNMKKQNEEQEKAVKKAKASETTIRTSNQILESITYNEETEEYDYSIHNDYLGGTDLIEALMDQISEHQRILGHRTVKALKNTTKK